MSPPQTQSKSEKPGLIKRKRGYCTWNIDDDGKVRDVYVSWDKYDPKQGEKRGGAYTTYWLEDEDKDPAYLYGVLRSIGFSSFEEDINALEQIGKMKHCKWARQIARALRKNRQ